MYLVMHLNGQEVGKVQLISSSKISEELEQLIKKHRKEINQANTEPQFYISDVPSSINNFKSLLSHTYKRGMTRK